MVSDEAMSKTPHEMRLDDWIQRLEKYMGFRTRVVWRNVYILAVEHALTLWAIWTYGLSLKWQTALLTYVMYIVGMFGVSAGVHRYWCHRAFYASPALRVILMLCFNVAGQKPIYSWVRDHRVHHKFSDTDADPHNTKRGFFFAHVGCYLMRKHPEVTRKGQQVDMSDIWNDPLVRFHDRYYGPLKYLTGFALPALVAVWCWNEDWRCVLAWQWARYIMLLHTNWGLNSVAHAFGTRPYNNILKATDNWYYALVVGIEGYHNYHHTFPWDYSSPEYGHPALSLTTKLIHLFRYLGMAWDLKKPSRELVQAVAARRGDGTDISKSFGE